MQTMLNNAVRLE